MKLRDCLKILPIKRYRDPPPVVGVVRLSGVIAASGGSPLRRNSLNLEGVARSLERAFDLPNVKAVAMIINSPGGSAVQSSLIARRVRSLAAEKEMPVFAFAEDVAASGGYWLACGADEIFADENSIIGSIGVISSSFGFQEFIRRYGIERRIYSAGDNKSQLDPFLDENADDVARLRAIQQDIHGGFIKHVRDRRGDKLKGSDEELFSGEFWSGRRAAELGLIDGLGDLRSEMRERYGDRVKLTVVGERRSWFGRRIAIGAAEKMTTGKPAPHAETTRGVGEIGEHLAMGLVSAIEQRALWKRFGL
jgi:signal peptide peptidase SppA